LLVNPVLWGLTAIWLLAGPGYTDPLFSHGIFAVAFANFTVGYLGNVIQLMVACRARGLRGAVAATFTAPVYWMLMTVAAYKGCGQLLRPSRRHYWELTRHGLVEAT
jgi:hypothetical protein